MTISLERAPYADGSAAKEKGGKGGKNSGAAAFRTLRIANDGRPFREDDWRRLRTIASGNPDAATVRATLFFSVQRSRARSEDRARPRGGGARIEISDQSSGASFFPELFRAHATTRDCMRCSLTCVRSFAF